MKPSNTALRNQLHAEAQKQVENFLAKGGEIQTSDIIVRPYQHRSVKDASKEYYRRRKNLENEGIIHEFQHRYK